MKNLRLLVLCLVTLLGFQRVFAQTENATITGRITDSSKAVIVGAEITLINTGTNARYEGKTNGSGSYVVGSIQPGPYRIEVGKSGFKTIVETGVVLHVQDTIELNFEMAVGAASESVTVSGKDTMWATTDSPAVSTVVTRDFVENMPLNGRSFQDLIALVPGTVSSGGFYSINGQRTDANYYMVDGVSANIFMSANLGGFPVQSLAGALPAQTALGTTQSLLSVDALQEFRIQTAGYSAEYGRQPGGEVQLTSRSGTNQWNGTAFDYLRNTIFDANNWFANQNGTPRQAERQNDFGGTLGGPVSIPGLYNGKDRTFFFFSYEGLRLLLPNFVHEYEPTVAFRQAAAAGVQPFLSAFPLPNGPLNTTDGCSIGTAACDALLAAGYSNPSSLDAISIRVDQNWGEKLRLFGRYADTPSNADSRVHPASTVTRTIANTRIATVGATVVLTTRLLNDLRFNYSQTVGDNGNFLDNFGGAVPFAQSLLAPPQYVKGGSVEVAANFCISGSALCNQPDIGNHIQQQRQYNLTDSLTWTVGNHGLKFGVDYRRLLPTYNNSSYASFLSFNSIAQVQQGVAADDFIQSFTPVSPKFTNLSLYSQDHWNLTSRLTLEYGLRWEFNPVPGEANGLFPLALTQVSDLSNLQLASRGTTPYKTRYLNFAPRVGFAWDVVNSTNHALVFRGGYGIYYDTGQAEWALAYSSVSPPFGALYDVQNVSVPISAAAVPPPPILSTPVPPYFNFGLMDPNLKLPYTEQYDLALDVGLSQRNSLTISYVGNQGHRLLETPVYAGLPNFSFVSLTDNAGSSNYNALQVQDRGYVTQGLQLIASYTLAHAIDNVSTDYYQFSAPIRGNSDTDIRQIFNAALNYEIPSMASNRFLHALTQGWLFSNRFTLQSGYPFNVIQGQYIDPVGRTISIYPDLVRGARIYLNNVPNIPGGWQLNPSAFSPVPLNPDGSPVRQGDVPRNFTKGPGFWSLNLAVQRSFPIRERLHLIFRAEAFNIFNHPNFTNIDSFLADPTFGQALTSAGIGAPNQLYATGSPRSWQFMLKLQF